MALRRCSEINHRPQGIQLETVRPFRSLHLLRSIFQHVVVLGERNTIMAHSLPRAGHHSIPPADESITCKSGACVSFMVPRSYGCRVQEGRKVVVLVDESNRHVHHLVV